MSSTEEHNDTETHQSFIKTPRQLITVVVLAFLVPIVIIIMLTHMVAASFHLNVGSDASSPASILSRIKPVATLKLVEPGTAAAASAQTATVAAAAPAPAASVPAASVPATPAPAAAPAQPSKKAAPANAAPATVAAIPGLPADAATNPEGEKLYKTVCFACHAAGVLGAPTFGSMEKWAPFIKTGLNTMVEHAIHGIGAMPPRGGSQATDAQMRAAVEYMVAHAK
ncbi:MAG: cytochrome c5 family protein [Candidimonas sp.]|nr:MAG: cytochrome c5 family protein [Candidimonas sp.]